jgi:hypothetical protein
VSITADVYNPLFETVNGNFALPDSNWLTLADWQANNGQGWDADSQVGGFSANCPAQSLP